MLSKVQADVLAEPDLSVLTEGERQVLALIGAGLATGEIARRLFRTPKTIEWYRGRLGRKLRVKNRVQLARIAIGAGLTSNPNQNGVPSAEGQSETQQAVEASGVGVWRWSAQPARFWLTGDLCGAVGESPSHAVGWLRVVHPDDSEPALTTLARAARGAETRFDIVLRVVALNGSARSVMVRGRCGGDGDRSCQRGAGVAVDVTGLAGAGVKTARAGAHAHGPGRTCSWCVPAAGGEASVSEAWPPVVQPRAQGIVAAGGPSGDAEEKRDAAEAASRIVRANLDPVRLLETARAAASDTPWRLEAAPSGAGDERTPTCHGVAVALRDGAGALRCVVGVTTVYGLEAARSATTRQGAMQMPGPLPGAASGGLAVELVKGRAATPIRT